MLLSVKNDVAVCSTQFNTTKLKVNALEIMRSLVLSKRNDAHVPYRNDFYRRGIRVKFRSRSPNRLLKSLYQMNQLFVNGTLIANNLYPVGKKKLRNRKRNFNPND